LHRDGEGAIILPEDIMLDIGWAEFADEIAMFFIDEGEIAEETI
jgi:hypothetical protein